MEREIEQIMPLNNLKRGNDMTVREFTRRVWYSQKIMIIKWQDFDKCKDIDDIQKAALMVGENWQLRSVNYEKVNNMLLDSYGVMDDTLIIEVH